MEDKEIIKQYENALDQIRVLYSNAFNDHLADIMSITRHGATGPAPDARSAQIAEAYLKRYRIIAPPEPETPKEVNDGR